MTRITFSSLALIALFGLAPAAIAAEESAPAATAPVTSNAAPQVSSVEECKQVGLNLAQAAEDKKLPDAKLDTLEDLMARMSDFCAEQKYAEASALAKDLKTLIEKM